MGGGEEKARPPRRPPPASIETLTCRTTGQKSGGEGQDQATKSGLHSDPPLWLVGSVSRDCLHTHSAQRPASQMSVLLPRWTRKAMIPAE